MVQSLLENSPAVPQNAKHRPTPLLLYTYSRVHQAGGGQWGRKGA